MADHDIDSVRAELQRLGYLTHGLERLLLQDALRSRTPVRAALRLALRTAPLGGGLLALPLAVGLAAANGNLMQSPFDLAPLVLHVWPPVTVMAPGELPLSHVALVVTNPATALWVIEYPPCATTLANVWVLDRVGLLSSSRMKLLGLRPPPAVYVKS